jgi:plastocyanin
MSHTSRTPFLRVAALAVASTLLLACTGDKGAAGGESATATGDAAASTGTAGGEQTPDAGGKVVTVKMITDGTSNRFEPATLEVHQGDVIRYTLESGVHNVHFLADSNPGRQGFPATPSDYLQLPGQTYDVKVTWAEGKYYFQCDPHAALGMVGHVEVEDKD